MGAAPLMPRILPELVKSARHDLAANPKSSLFWARLQSLAHAATIKANGEWVNGNL